MTSLRERFVLTLEVMPDGSATAVIRLRRFLKMAKRAYGLRCTRAEAFPDTPTAEHEEGTARACPIPQPPRPDRPRVKWTARPRRVHGTDRRA